MDIGSYGYLKGTNNKCTYKLTDHLMVNIETIIALASMAYIVDLDAYELHRGMTKCSTSLFMNVVVYIL